MRVKLTLKSNFPDFSKTYFLLKSLYFMKESIKYLRRSLGYYIRNKVYRTLFHSGLFCDLYYREKDLNLQDADTTLLIHYVDFGIEEGRIPSPFFDLSFYTEHYDVPDNIDPFLHYVTTGIEKNYKPCSWFDPIFYKQHYLHSAFPAGSALQHYNKKGWQQGLYPNRELFALPVKPLISILIPVFNASVHQLNDCIFSVIYQSYPRWELCLVDDCSTNDDVRPLLERWAAVDRRIKVDFLPTNSGISAATNRAAELATGDYLAFLDNDDELAPECFSTIVKNINKENAELYYTDENLVNDDNKVVGVFYKPDFNPELLLSHNYVTHLVVAKTTLFEKVGGFDSEKDGAQDFDLFLKMSEKAAGIVHIPQILYHWRATASSTSIDHSQKSYANEAGRKSVVDALQRRGIQGRADFTDWKFYYTARRCVEEQPLISVVLFHSQHVELVHCLQHLLENSFYPSLEIILLQGAEFLADNGIEHGEQVISITQLLEKESIPASLNHAVKQCSGEYIVFLNAAIRVCNRNWLSRFLEYFSEKNVAMVGGELISEKPKYAVSRVPDINNHSVGYYTQFLQDCSRHLNGLRWPQNVCSLSWNLVMVDRKKFVEVGGFDEKRFPDLFADTDLCFRLYEAGYNLVYTPLVSGELLELDADDGEQQLEQESFHAKKQFQKRWRRFLLNGDPYYNYGVLKEAGIGLDAFKKWYAGVD